jgi:hypothetical protein
LHLNLPILDQLADCQSVLIAGAGGGFDVFSGLPLYFTLRELGKTVHLANFSFTELTLVPIVSEPIILLDNLLMGACGPLKRLLPTYPEGYLSQWFHEIRGEDVTIWMFARTGAAPLVEAYAVLIDHLKIDAIILVDGGVDSLMRGDEIGAGTLVEDSISLAAVDPLDISVKLLACIGFGTEVEESVCHYNALENMAMLAKEGAFLGSCALTPQMECFQLFEAASRYVWELPHHAKSHISTRIIPAVNGEFGDYHMYDESRHNTIFVSPLMSLYWFFNANAVIRRSLIIDAIRHTNSTTQAIMICTDFMSKRNLRPRRSIPY